MKVLIFLFLFSCANSKKIEEVSSVSIGTENQNTVKIDKNLKEQEVIDKEEEVEVKQPSIALTIYSSLYHSLATVELIKEIEKKEIAINTMSSHGFGIITLALYSRDKSISNVEWSLFKLLKNLKGKVPYSKEWKEVVIEFIDREFPSQKMKDLNPKLLIPSLDRENKVVFSQEGLVKSALKNVINLEQKFNFLTKPQIYHYSMDRNGIDLNFAISFLPEAPTFNRLNGYPYGLITRHLGLVINAKEDISLVRSNHITSVDKLSPITDINQMYKPGILLFTKNIEERIKSWQEDSSTGFQYQ